MTSSVKSSETKRLTRVEWTPHGILSRLKWNGQPPKISLILDVEHEFLLTATFTTHPRESDLHEKELWGVLYKELDKANVWDEETWSRFDVQELPSAAVGVEADHGSYNVPASLH